MDPFLRKLYVDLTMDDYNAYRLREDDTEGYMYSDNTIMRALRKLEAAEDADEFSYLVKAMREYGPRAGASMNYETSNYAGQDFFDQRLEDYREAGRRGDILGQGKAMARVGMGLLNPLSSGDKRAGVTRGLLRYISERE